MSSAARLLESKARTASPTIETIRTPGQFGRGLLLVLDITASPNNAETLTPALQVYDLVSGKFLAITAFVALKGETIGAVPNPSTFLYSIVPGGAETAAIANHEVQSLGIPAEWRVALTHSSTGSWTYSLGYQSLE